MKTLRYLILGWLMTAMVARAQQTTEADVTMAAQEAALNANQAALAASAGHAQITEPGWYNGSQRDPSTFSPPGNNGAPQVTALPAGQSSVQFGPLDSQQNPSDIAAAITPDIQALADGLQDNPVKIYNYVHDHIKYVLYFGSKKGAELTLLEKSGNDFDQSALLVALLRAAGYNATYQFGWMEVPYDNPDGSQRDLHHWLQLNLSNTNWNYTSNYLFNLFWNVRGYPTIDYLSRYQSDTNTFIFQRVWVTMSIGSTNYYLDPAFKVSEPITNLVNLTSATSMSSNALMSAAGGTDTGNYVQSLNEANLRNTLTSYTTNLLGYLQTHYPNASMQQVLGGWQIVPATNTTLPTSLIFPTVSYEPPAPMYVTNWTVIPTNLMATLSITFGNTNYQWFMPQLEGQRLSLTFDSSGNAQLWQDDTLLAQSSTTSSQTNVELYVNQPFGSWDATNNTLIPDTFGDLDATTAYQRTSATYALIYAFEPDWSWLQERENKLDSYLVQGLSPTSRQVTSETLNIMGLNWMLQTEYAGHLIEQQLGILPQFHCRLGRMAQESGHGYYVDAYMELSGFVSNSGEDAANKDKENRDFDLFGYFGSALENGIIEQLQNTNLVGASTVKMLEIANTNGQPVYLATSNNWSSGPNILGTLINYYDFNTLVQLTEMINYEGYSILLPQNESNYVAGVGSWRGYGYVGHVNNTSNQITAFTISGGYNGGYASSPTATANPSYVDQSGDSQPQYFSSVPVWTPDPTAADPVDMADGTFQIEHTDLSVGQAEPHGITLSRYYNGTRRFSNPAGMAAGWINNYCVNVATIPAPEAGLGGTTPAQAAPMLAATCAAISLYSDANPEPKNWMVTDLIAKWGIDQLTKNGASANLGKDTVQFVRQPNGKFTPPANCTMTLIQTNSGYWLQLRHGNTFKFNAAGLLTNIVDQYGQSVNLTYTSSNWVSTVKDWQNRHTLTFNYTGTPSRLTSVSDGTHTIDYGYSTAYNSQGDLTSFTDAEGKTSTYAYDTNHNLTATVDALNHLVVSNNYDSLGHVTTQLTEGDTNQTWHIFWSGWQTIAQDPAGDQQTYFYDDQSRLIGTEDALGNLTQTFYDGQNHVVMTISPLDEINQYFYDGNNNLTNAVDTLGFTNQFVYDNQNNLIRSIDGRGDVSTFGYNSEFSLTGQTNGAGDWVNFAYNSDGTLHTCIDSGGQTQYGYDSYGILNSITYPNADHESFVNDDSLGDVTSHTDGNGNITTFQYNNRRELTNTIAPTNVVTSVAYDPNDNVASTTDARGNVTSNTWSATRLLLTTTLPTFAAGTPVLTHEYDNRDWLSETLDPYEEPTLYTNNPDDWLVSQTDPLQRTTTFGFDADGRKIAITNAAQEVTRQTWNRRGDLIALTDGAEHTSLRAYDGAGNQIILTNRNGNVWQFQFDGANRLTNAIPPSPMQPASQTWDHQGLLSTVTDPAHQTTYLYYDGRNRLTNRADNTGITLYTFDANDNRTTASENGLTNSWTFDAYNRVSTYRDAYGNLIQYKRDADGNVTNLIYPGGKNVYYTFDNDNHLIQVKDWAGRITTFQYDLAGRLTSVIRPNGTFRTLSYNAAGQLTNIWEQMPNGLPIAWCRFNWNPNSTMGWEFAAPLPHTNSPPTRTMTYNADNELASVDSSPVTEDSDGNLTYGPLTNDTFVTYAFDTRNRLLNVGGVTNVYDGMNNRIGQSYGTNSITYVVNPNANLPQVLERIKNGVTTYYIYGMGLLYQITETATSTNTLTYHYDYRGSTIALTDDNGMVVDRFEYSLYGTLTYRAGTDDTPFLFNGRYGVMSDPNGLLYLRARYYSPYLCRFINPDPTGFKGGLNWYAYANGNPVTMTDPSGLGAIGDYTGLSWLTGSSATPTDLTDPFSLAIANEQPDWVDKTIDYINATIEAHQQAEAARLAQMTPFERQLYQTFNMLAAMSVPEAGGPEMLAAEQTTAGNTFFHYTQAEIPVGQGLNINSGVTTVGNLNASEAMFNLGIDKPTYVYPITLENPADYLIQDLGTPARNQIPSWRVIQQTPPGSVGMPIPVPPAP